MADNEQNIRDFFDKYGQTASGGAPSGSTTTSISESSTSGSTTEGIIAYAIENTGGAAATIDGVSFATGSGVVVEGNGLPLDSISFDGTGTTLRILEVALA